MAKNVLSITLLLLLTTFNYCFAQDTLPTILQPDVRELLEAKVEVNQEEVISTGSFKEALLREAAGIMSVISAETIRNTAARDLRELLLIVAGFDFNLEASDNLVTLVVRGNSAASAGLLMMVNDMMLNDIAYGTYLFGNRIPLDHIERIEIIRGTGSLQYGGAASLAVINIITKKYEQGIGSTISVQNGVSDGNFSRHNLYFSTAQRYHNNVDISLSAFRDYLRQSNGTDKPMINGTEKFINYADSAMGTSTNINFGLKYKELKVNLLYEDFESKNTYLEGGVYTKTMYATISNTFHFGKKLTFTPLYSFRSQEPWNYYNHPTSVQLYNLDIRRHTISGIFNYIPHKNLAINTGFSFFDDILTAQYPQQIFTNGTGRFTVNNFGLLAEMTYNSKLGNLIVGARLDKYSSTKEPVLIPRLAYTKIFGHFHAKALYSFAFRNPMTAEIGIATKGIEAQKSQSVEVEVGYKWKDKLTIAANVFNIINYDVIVYTFNNNVSDYANQGSSGTNGVEVELKYQYKKFYLRSNYSFYTTNYSKNGLASLFFTVKPEDQTPDNLIPDNNNQFLGIANHKVTAQMAYKWTSKLSSQLTFIGHSARTVPMGYETFQQAATYLLNLNFSYKNLFVNGLTLDAGVYNLLNQRLIVAPYNFGDEAFYTLDNNREFVLKVKYSL